MSFNNDNLKLVLITIHDLGKSHPLNRVDTSEIAKKTNLKNQELYDILKFLKKEDYLKAHSSLEAMYGIGGGSLQVSLTDKGLSVIEELN